MLIDISANIENNAKTINEMNNVFKNLNLIEPYKLKFTQEEKIAEILEYIKNCG